MDKTSLSFSLINILCLLYLLKFYLPLILPEEQMNFKLSNIPGNSVYINYKFALFSAPFAFDASLADENLPIELLEMQCDSIVKAKYDAVGVSDFYSYLPEQFQEICMLHFSMFGNTYTRVSQ